MIGKSTRIFIPQMTLKDLIKSRDPKYLKHDQRVGQLKESSLLSSYASTVEYSTRSSKYDQNKLKYKQKFLFKDFVYIAKDLEIPLKEAIEYSINHGDVHVNCSCPAFLYWGYRYMATQLDYLYGIPRENRRPKRNNVKLEGTVCKHITKATQSLFKDADQIRRQFALYYKRLGARPSWKEEDEWLLEGLDEWA